MLVLLLFSSSLDLTHPCLSFHRSEYWKLVIIHHSFAPPYSITEYHKISKHWALEYSIFTIVYHNITILNISDIKNKISGKSQETWDWELCGQITTNFDILQHLLTRMMFCLCARDHSLVIVYEYRMLIPIRSIGPCDQNYPFIHAPLILYRSGQILSASLFTILSFRGLDYMWEDFFRGMYYMYVGGKHISLYSFCHQPPTYLMIPGINK